MSSKKPIINLILIFYENKNLGKKSIKNKEKF
jgi:hypothetical protein